MDKLKTSILEDDKNEFKEKWDTFTRNSIRKTIKAFLNTYGGIIYVGIKDDRTIIGVTEQDYDEISKWVSDVFGFNSLIKVKFDNDKVVNIIVDYDTDIILENNNYSAWVRIQSTTKLLRDKELKKYILERENKFQNWKHKLELFLKEGTIKSIYGNEKFSRESHDSIEIFINNFSSLATTGEYHYLNIETDQPFFIEFRKKIIWSHKQFEISIDILWQSALSNWLLQLELKINPGILKMTVLYFTTYKVVFDKKFNFTKIEEGQDLGIRSHFYKKAIENINEIGIPMEYIDNFKTAFSEYFYYLEKIVRDNSSKIEENIKKLINL